MDSYRIEVAGLTRDLPICKVSDEIMFAAFVILGDTELTVNSARELAKLAPEHDVLITAEAKGIPLIHEMARQMGENKYVVARKSPKLYMKDIISTSVKSISTQTIQSLYLDGDDAKFLKGKKVLIIDDVISTGESLKAVEKLVAEVGGEIVGKMAILAEGAAIGRDDIVCLGELPIF